MSREEEEISQLKAALVEEALAHERTKDHLAAMQRDRDALAVRVRELEAKTAELAWGGSQ